MQFAPIAIVGRACLMPGACSPEALWRLVHNGGCALTEVPHGRWRVPIASDEVGPVGGFVTGFDQLFDPTGFALPPAQLDGLDPLFLWTLHTAREALRDAGVCVDAAGDAASMRLLAQTTAIFGNLGFPSASLSRLAEWVWLDAASTDGVDGKRTAAIGPERPDPRNRYGSGLPALLLEQALRLGCGAFAIDAACASGLYALKFACDRLCDRRARMALAGGVNAADHLFIQHGFSALGANSGSGQSRPFHRGADGLIPGEGAGFLVLQRLEDALADGRTIHGVIRGIGLSNDGRGSALLAPHGPSQARAMEYAYRMAGLPPTEVSLIECHATGTPVGDRAELRSMADVFQAESTLAAESGAAPSPTSAANIAIGSIKGNIGHLLTAAGIAGIIKVLEALRRRILPPTRHLGPVLDEVAAAPFRLLTAPEPWDLEHTRSGRRIAAVSAFGFGGNNGHVIIEEWPEEGRPRSADSASIASVSPALSPSSVARSSEESGDSADIAIVALGVIAGEVADRHQFATTLSRNTPAGEPRTERVSLHRQRLRLPPKDLGKALGQHLMMLAVADQALAELGGDLAHRDRTGVFVGMEVDPEVARYGFRWRLAHWVQTWAAHQPQDHAADADAWAAWLRSASNGVVQSLDSAGVLGTMPNLVANRINVHGNLGGGSSTVSAGPCSGLEALDLAIRALLAGELDTAVVGAVDASCNPVHEWAAKHGGIGDTAEAGDAAVALVLQRLEDAERAGRTIYAVLRRPGADGVDGAEVGKDDAIWTPSPADVDRRFGHAYAAAGLLHLAVAADCLRRRILPGGRPWLSSNGARRARVQMQAPPSQRRLSVALREYMGPNRDHGNTTDSGVDEGAHLHFEAHWPPLTLPPWPQPTELGTGADKSPPPRPDGYQVMQPAPPLPLPAYTPTPAYTPVQTSPRSLLQLPPQSPAPSTSAQPASVIATVGRVHRSFLQRQTALHQQFLQYQLQASQCLVTSMPSMGSTPAVAPACTTEMTALETAMPTSENAVPAATPVIWGRRELEIHASGNISALFGPRFAAQDALPRQVRMPEPPLLLADRVVALRAQPASMNTGATGSLSSETDVDGDAWYLHHGRMPAGIMIEAGQADLLLVSYLGVDLYKQGDRVYRLLGCELTYRGDLPMPGETLHYDIHIDRYARQGDIQLMFFHYDCHVAGELRLEVRNGQAGFFGDRELAESAGVLWSPEDVDPGEKLPSPSMLTERRRFTAEEVNAFARGDAYACFGQGFEWAQTHVRSPSIQPGKMLRLDAVVDLDAAGGPWRQGYLRAEAAVSADDWYFAGHFKNDPCMPGTLMFEGCLQALAFYLAALGCTLPRDGWRFQPVCDRPFQLRCRGQVTPTSRKIVYEVFVREIILEPIPTVRADLLGTADGCKAFHAADVALELVPDWPLARGDTSPAERAASKAVAIAGGHPFDYASMLACAWGRPSEAFGPMYAGFDGHRRVPRLPGPPYHFMSRATRIGFRDPKSDAESGLTAWASGDADAYIGAMKAGTTVEIEYDIDQETWYFAENRFPTMPFCVFLEAALQPCGWLGSFIGSTLAGKSTGSVHREPGPHDLVFRNLDGTLTMTGEVRNRSQTLRTVVTVANISRFGDTVIEAFAVECFLGQESVCTMDTVFGFFTADALRQQVGLPTSDEDRAQLTAPCDDVRCLSRGVGRGQLGLPAPMLRMLDRITGFWPSGGAAQLGRVRGEKDVNPAEWFFKAHFFQDPVQPGSLGIEALIQLLQYFMLEQRMDAGIDQPRFEPIAIDRAITWKYRGQVLPHHCLITTTLELTQIGRDQRGPFAVAKGSLWVDGLRIYEVQELAMRIVSAQPHNDETMPWQHHEPQYECSGAPQVQTDCEAAAEASTLRWDLTPVHRYWNRQFACPDGWLGQDLATALIQTYVNRFIVTDPASLQPLRGRSAIYLGNHQVQIESLLITNLLSAYLGTRVITIANAKHRRRWLGALRHHLMSRPRAVDPDNIAYFDPRTPAAMLPILADLKARIAAGDTVPLFAHPAGTRSRSARDRLKRVSSVFFDLALEAEMPIVPVRFAGGLPTEPLASGKLEVPWQHGNQDYYIGTPIEPAQLRTLAYGERAGVIADAIHALGPAPEHETPRPGDRVFANRCRFLRETRGASYIGAILLAALERLPNPGPDSELVLRSIEGGTIAMPADEHGQWLTDFIQWLYVRKPR